MSAPEKAATGAAGKPRTPRSSSRPGTPLSKQSLVEAALGVLDEHGLDGLTVRAVATRLGVQAPALYWHVKNKQDLLDEAATEIWRRIIAEMASLPADLDWREGMFRFAQLTRQTLLSYRDGARTFSGTYITDTDVLRDQEDLVSRMTAQGFTVPDVIRANRLLYHFVIGFCIEEQAVQQVTATGDNRYAVQTRVRRLDERSPSADHPAAHPAHHSATQASSTYESPTQGSSAQESSEGLFGDPDDRFADQVGLILDTVARLQH